MPAQYLGGAHRGRMCMHTFIGVILCGHLRLYVYLFLINTYCLIKETWGSSCGLRQKSMIFFGKTENKDGVRRENKRSARQNLMYFLSKID